MERYLLSEEFISSDLTGISLCKKMLHVRGYHEKIFLYINCIFSFRLLVVFVRSKMWPFLKTIYLSEVHEIDFHFHPTHSEKISHCNSQALSL